MINYTNTHMPANMNAARCVDILNNVRDDVSGVAECLCSLSEMARETSLEPTSLAVLADVLVFAADAINETVATMCWVGKESKNAEESN